MNWTETVERYIREGRTVSGGCGASSDQKQIASDQKANFETMSNEAQQVFGNSSQIFKDLTSSFEPVVAAGPGQNGYTEPELAALRSQAITNTGNAYRNAATAAGERISAAGGGNALLPSGTEAAIQGDIATRGAAQTADALTGINIRNAEVGRQNWMNAAGVLSGATNVFNPATSFSNATTGAGNSAMSSANTVQQANRQWVGDAMGILGDATSIAGSFMGMPGGGGGGGSSFSNSAGSQTPGGVPEYGS